MADLDEQQQASLDGREFVYTFELEDDEQSGVYGYRHVECAKRTDVGKARILGNVIDKEAMLKEDFECWGCNGWMWLPPRSVEETARYTAMWEADMDR